MLIIYLDDIESRIMRKLDFYIQEFWKKKKNQIEKKKNSAALFCFFNLKFQSFS